MLFLKHYIFLCFLGLQVHKWIHFTNWLAPSEDHNLDTGAPPTVEDTSWRTNSSRFSATFFVVISPYVFDMGAECQHYFLETLQLSSAVDVWEAQGSEWGERELGGESWGFIWCCSFLSKKLHQLSSVENSWCGWRLPTIQLG